MRFRQPKHTVRHGPQQPHPYIKYFRRDLVGVVEAAKHECSFGQMTFGPRRQTFRDTRFVIAEPISIRLICVGQPYHPLAIEAEMVLGNNRPIADDIVDAIGAHRPRIAEKIDLDGRNAPRQHIGAAMSRKSSQIDQNVDFTAANQSRQIRIAHVFYVDKMLDCRLYSAPHSRVVIRPERKRDSLETRLVVRFKETDGKMPDRVVAEIGREIADPNAIVRVSLATPGRWKRMAIG